MLSRIILLALPVQTVNGSFVPVTVFADIEVCPTLDLGFNLFLNWRSVPIPDLATDRPNHSIKERQTS